MLGGNASGAPFDQRKIILRFGFGELIFGTRVERCACAAGCVEEQKFSSKCVRRNICRTELRHALFECGADVHALGKTRITQRR